MKRNYLLMCFAVSLLSAPLARGQSIWPSTLNAAGGSATVLGVQLEWSVGEMALVNTFSTPSIIVTQGVLQPENGVTAVPEQTLASQLQIFPNPGSSVVNIRYTSAKEGKLSYSLLDMTGKLISSQKTEVKQGLNNQVIDISSLAAATYMLEVSMEATGNGTETTSYKIQKLQ